MRFTDVKTDTLNLRVSPTFKRTLRQAAELEQRSMVNLLEVLLREYCERKGIPSLGGKSMPSHSMRTSRRPLGGS